MLGQKQCALVREEGENEDGILAPKKWSVRVKTVEKCVAENDKDLDMSLWLKYLKDGRDTIGLLKCAVCAEFEARLVGMDNLCRMEHLMY